MIKKVILIILISISCLIYNFSYSAIPLESDQIDTIENLYNINFDGIDWQITKYKQNNLIGKKKIIYDAKNFQLNDIFPSSTKYVTVTFGEDEIFKTSVFWANQDEKTMIEEVLNDILDGKVEVIYTKRNEIDDKNYYPVYRFTFNFNNLNYVIQFENGKGNHRSYNINDTLINEDELSLLLNFIYDVLNV